MSYYFNCNKWLKVQIKDRHIKRLLKYFSLLRINIMHISNIKKTIKIKTFSFLKTLLAKQIQLKLEILQIDSLFTNSKY